ncbi:DUF350 domain-containing protein [Aliikangiella sp. IMCC44359]|uniref:DUF350 domain-containing protein n=1 Tax=Aliikangiella sp. IMCC44359 TaxID=3459125 RepID=UPI00403B1D8D
MNLNQLDIWNIQAFTLDLLVFVGLLISLKFLKGALSSVQSQAELVDKNNAAFGLSLGGGILSVGIMLTGVSSGDFADSLVEEVTAMAIFGVLGLVLILLGRMLQDKLVLRQVDIHGELAKDNMACALLDVGHMLAVGLIVRSAMIWIPNSDLSIIPLLVAAFFMSQLVVSIASLYRVKLFKARNANHGNNLQEAIIQGNNALALRYAAFIIGAAFAVTAASNIVTFSLENMWLSAAIWAGLALAMVPVYSLIVLIIRKLVLSGVDVAEEVDRQGNVGIAAVEAAIFVATGLVFTALI